MVEKGNWIPATYTILFDERRMQQCNSVIQRNEYEPGILNFALPTYLAVHSP